MLSLYVSSEKSFLNFYCKPRITTVQKTIRNHFFCQKYAEIKTILGTGYKNLFLVVVSINIKVGSLSAFNMGFLFYFNILLVIIFCLKI